LSLLKLLNIGIFSSFTQDVGFDLPPDSVIFFERSSESDPIPSGFTIFEEANNKLFFGTTNTAENGTLESVSSSIVNQVFNTTGAGPHASPPSNFLRGTIYPGPPGPSPTVPVAGLTVYRGNAGNHVHSTAATTVPVPSEIKPPGRYLVPITNSSTVSQVPQNAIIFSVSSFSGFQRKTFDTITSGVYVGTTKNSRSKVGESISMSINLNPSGAHNHPSPASGTVPYSTAPTGKPGFVTTPRISAPGPESTGAVHTHPTFSLTDIKVLQPFKHLLPFIATSSKTVKSGMIVMFKGSTIPSGWKICDGTNGTPDMNGYFLGYDNNENGHDIVKSGRRLNYQSNQYPLTPSSTPTHVDNSTYYRMEHPDSSFPAFITLTTAPWPHQHQTNNGAIFQVNHPNNFHTLYPVPHTHQIQRGPTAPPNPWLRLPFTFVPERIKIVFIQKE